MRSVTLLIASGVLWLGLVQLSGRLGIPPQIISLLRSGYIGTFSIFLLLELRRGDGLSALRPRGLYLYLAPLLSLFILAFYSADLVLTPRLLALVAVFYACQFMLLYLRSAMGQIRSAVWDLVPPFILLVLCAGTFTLAVGAVATAGFLYWLLSRPIDGGDRSDAVDSVIMQLPSICIAPVVLIALRDIFDAQHAIPREHVESFGLIVNGVGAAVWTAIVMRASNILRPSALGLWVASTAAAALLPFFPVGIVASALAICVAEGFRGANWLGLTYLLSHLGRWRGFGVNLFATMLPLCALWIGTHHLPVQYLMLVYAVFLAPVPLLTIWLGRPVVRPVATAG
ncbi:hypothetical protein OMP43_03065 [Sphingomonas sp. CBMAI 2297]|uniref:hypothetical protein n=1 Tax=Sphingomonas sp. CBMAI 2297 TaxID=2991720 RepID=UPI002455D937|nr:hypothetical protein [Sphingomonas sp. CBMAI 2297]MDH4742994.1 hypothetical protein [Sphingomonas sp. CBMAI 2297]